MVTYRVNTTCSTFSAEFEIPAGNRVQLDLPINSSCTVHLDAGTERGYNNSLHPSSVIIPSHHDGQLCIGNLALPALSPVFT